MLHVLKHSTKDCVGLLIKKADTIVDVIPLFHESIVGPTLDAAFHMLQDFYLSPNPSYSIAGVYEASVNSKDSKFLPATKRILEVLEDSVADPISFKITLKDNDANEIEITNTDRINCKTTSDDIEQFLS